MKTTTKVITTCVSLVLAVSLCGQTKVNQTGKGTSPKTSVKYATSLPAKTTVTPKTSKAANTVPVKKTEPQNNKISKKEPVHTLSDNGFEDYRNAIGLRAGQTSGVTFKHFFTSNNAMEAILGIWPNAVGLTGLYEKYVPFGDVRGLNWYFGFGGHFSVTTGRLYYVYREGNRYYTYRYNYPGIGIGIDGVAGAEYKIPSVPVAISFDIKPFVEVNSAGVLFTSFDPGLGIKVTF